MESPYRKQINEMVWSYSRLHTYETCPAAFKRLYLDQCEKADNAFAQFGTLCHSILESYEKGELAEYELSSVFESEWGNEVTHPFPSFRGVSMGDKYYSDGFRYFDAFDGFPENWEIIGAEIDAEFAYKGRNFIGFIDLLVRDKEDGKLIVVDHKSKNGFKSAAELNEYAIQLYLYSKWVHDHYGEYPKELKFNTFRKSEIVTVPFEESAYQAALEWAIHIIDTALNDFDFWDKIYLQYERTGKDLTTYHNNDFFCSYLCSCRRLCDRSPEGVCEE